MRECPVPAAILLRVIKALSTLFWIALAPAREPHQKERLLFTHKNGDLGALSVNGAKLPRSNLEKAIVTYRIGFCATLLARADEWTGVYTSSELFSSRNDFDKPSGLQKRKTSDYTSTSVASVTFSPKCWNTALQCLLWKCNYSKTC